MDVRSAQTFCKILSRIKQEGLGYFQLEPSVRKYCNLFKQIKILVLDKSQIFNIIRIALRGWLKTTCYVFSKENDPL